MPSDDELVELARQAQSRAVADITQYRVGAALLTADGEVFLGCNVEHIVLAETVCAEKVAILKAISEGHTAFAKVAVYTDSSPPATPCGSCRQMLHRWDIHDVVAANSQGEVAHWRLETLLPGAFKLTLD